MHKVLVVWREGDCVGACRNRKGVCGFGSAEIELLPELRFYLTYEVGDVVWKALGFILKVGKELFIGRHWSLPM